jgi:hypothetical protein
MPFIREQFLTLWIDEKKRGSIDRIDVISMRISHTSERYKQHKAAKNNGRMDSNDIPLTQVNTNALIFPKLFQSILGRKINSHGEVLNSK